MTRSDADRFTQVALDEGRAVHDDLRQTLLAGLTLTVPLLVTVLILGWALNTVSSALAPLANVFGGLGIVGDDRAIVLQTLAAATVFGLILFVGLAARHGPDMRLGSRFDTLVADIPAVGTIYNSVDRMSAVLLEGDTESFREVKVVEFPRADCYAIAFLTTDSPGVVEDAVGESDLLTLFVPMAPNPVMGGHLLTVPEERVYDTDMSVEDGMEAVMTTGLVMDDDVRDGQSGTDTAATP